MTQQLVNVGSVAGDGTGSRGQIPFTIVNQNDTELYQNAYFTGIDSGLINAPVIATVLPTPAVFNRKLNTVVMFYPAFANTGPATLTVSGTAAAALLNSSGNPLTGGELSPTIPLIASWNSTAWQIVGSNASGPWPRTQAEITAGITPVNLGYYPGYVDRYGLNNGVNDMALAFNTAAVIAKASGVAVRFGATAPYLCQTPINYTTAGAPNANGILTIYDGTPSLDAANQPIIANHTSHVFDMTGTPGCSFMRVGITTGASNPQTAFFQARNNSLGTGVSAPPTGQAIFFECIVAGKFTKTLNYNFGAENDITWGGSYTNSYTGGPTSLLCWTANNILALQSSVPAVPVAVAPGSGGGGVSQSSTNHRVFGGTFVQQGASTTGSDVFYIEQSDFTRIRDVYTATQGGGRSTLYHDMSYEPSNYAYISGVDSELPSSAPQYGILHSDNMYTPTGWKVEDSRFPNAVYLMTTAGSTTLVTYDNFHLRNLSEGGTNHGINNPGRIQNSVLDLMNAVLNIGTSANNRLTGNCAGWNITTRITDNWCDTGATNASITTVTTSAGITSSSGALIARARIEFTGRRLVFSILLASTAGNIAITANSTITLTAPGVNQSMAPVDPGTCVVIDQSTGTCNGASVVASSTSALITIPVAVTAVNHNIVVSGTIFLT